MRCGRMAIESNKAVTLSTSGVTFNDVIAVARQNAKVVISPEAIVAISASRKYIEDYAAGDSRLWSINRFRGIG